MVVVVLVGVLVVVVVIGGVRSGGCGRGVSN